MQYSTDYLIRRSSYPSFPRLVIALSGAINLAGEAAWHRLASLLAGDYYTAYAALTCSFIFGSAIGALFGAVRPRSVWLCEVIPAIWTIAWAIAIRQGAFGASIPLWFVLVSIFIPGFALGAHGPAYANLHPGSRFAITTWLYHLGGFIGLVLLAYLLGNLLSLSSQLFFIGSVQLILGVYVRSLRPRLPAKYAINKPGSPAWQLSRAEILSFLFGIFGFWWLMCSLSEAVFLSYPIRVVQIAILISSIGWISVGSGISQQLRSTTWSIPLFAGATAALAIATSPIIATYVLPKTDILGFSLSITLIALVLTSPLTFSAAYYAIAADKLRDEGYMPGVGGGRVWCFAAIGNIIGCCIAMKWGETAAPATFLFLIVGTSLMTNNGRPRWLPYALSILVLGAHVVLLQTGAWRNLEQRHAGIGVAWPKAEASQIERTGLWWDATEFRQHGLEDKPAAVFVIDGHESTDYFAGYELAAGLVPATYFPHLAAGRALVVGIGTGQTAWAVAHTMKDGADIVDISPAAIAAAHRLSAYNGDVLNDPKVQLIRDDAMRVLASCKPGSYDVIINTATAPALMNSAKLWTIEFTKAASRCLSPAGVYLTYFVQSFAHTKEDIDYLLRPLAQTFKHVDVTTNPYSMVAAYNEDRQFIARNLNISLLDGKSSAEYLLRLAPRLFAEADGRPKIRNPIGRIHDWPLDKAGPVPEMDRGDLEALSVKYYIDTMVHGWNGDLQQAVQAAADGNYRPIENLK